MLLAWDRSELFSSNDLSGKLFLFAKLALLDADENVLVTAPRYYIISHDHLGVLLRPHAQVHEVGISLVELLEGGLGLHDQVSDEGSVLHGRDVIFGEVFHGDTYTLAGQPRNFLTIEVDDYVADGAWLLHQLVQVLLHFTLILVCL